MRKDKEKRHTRLVELIMKILASGDPETVKVFEGAKWAVMSQPEWCKALAISDRTLRDLAKLPPVVATKTVNAAQKPVVYYRIASEPHYSSRHVANQMAMYYRKKYNLKRVSLREWGCLVGLAQGWPQGAQVEIFKAVLSDWKMFMSGVKNLDPDSPHSIRFYEWPVIPLIRKFRSLGLEMYIIKTQEKQEIPHASVVALSPEVLGGPILKCIGH